MVAERVELALPKLESVVAELVGPDEEEIEVARRVRLAACRGSKRRCMERDDRPSREHRLKSPE